MSYHQFKGQNGKPFGSFQVYRYEPKNNTSEWVLTGYDGSFQVYRYEPKNNTSEWVLTGDDTCSKEEVIHVRRMYPLAGWYWREGFPGVFSDWEATGGPFETEQDAINDAIEGTFVPLMTIQDIEDYLTDNYTHLSEEQIKDVSPTIQSKLCYEGIYTQIDTLVLYLLGNLGDSEQTPPE